VSPCCGAGVDEVGRATNDWFEQRGRSTGYLGRSTSTLGEGLQRLHRLLNDIRDHNQTLARLDAVPGAQNGLVLVRRIGTGHMRRKVAAQQAWHLVGSAPPPVCEVVEYVLIGKRLGSLKGRREVVIAAV